MREMKTEQTSARRRRLVFFSRSLPRWLPKRRLLNAFGTCPNAPSVERPRRHGSHVSPREAGTWHAPESVGMPADAMARGFARWSRRVGRGLVRSRGGASATPVVPTPEHPGGGSVDPGTFARGWRARPALGASLRLASTAAGTPVFAGATCERVDVELGTARTRVTVGFETGRVARLRERRRGRLDGRHRRDVRGDDRAPARFGREFLPLSVDYRERASAYGKIPATFTRREAAAQRSRGARDARRRAHRGQASVPEGLPQERDQRAGGGAGVRPEPGPGGARGERRERGARRLRHTLRRARRRARASP